MTGQRVDTQTTTGNGNHPVSERLQAVSVALTVLRTGKAETWSQIPGGVIDGPEPLIALSDRQRDLLTDHLDVVALLSPTLRSTVDRDGCSQISIAECRSCRRWMFAAGGFSKPSTCTLAVGCKGKFDTVRPAVRASD